MHNGKTYCKKIGGWGDNVHIFVVTIRAKLMKKQFQIIAEHDYMNYTTPLSIDLLISVKSSYHYFTNMSCVRFLGPPSIT